MRVTTAILKLAGDASRLAVTLIGEYIEERFAAETREQLAGRLRDATERIAELRGQNEALEEKLDGMRFNGPSLWKDEVDAILWAFGIPSLAQNLPHKLAFRNLYDRCDHMPMTSEELGRQVEDVISGRAQVRTWEETFGPDEPQKPDFDNDPGKDVDDDIPF